MNCTHPNDDGTTCGAEFQTPHNGTYLHNGTTHYKLTCASGHKRVCWQDGDTVRQGRTGRKAGADNRSTPKSVRPGARFLERLKAAGYTVQDWWNYTESLDIPDRG